MRKQNPKSVCLLLQGGTLSSTDAYIQVIKAVTLIATRAKVV